MNSRLEYRGHPVRLRYQRNAGIIALRCDNKHRYTICMPEGTNESDAEMYLAAFSGEKRLSAAATEWEELKTLCAQWSAEMGIPEPELLLSDSSRFWGQADWSAREIRLSRQLLDMPSVCGEEVLLHELCHFLHHDHDRNFWQLLSGRMPDWALREGMLRNMGAKGDNR